MRLDVNEIITKFQSMRQDTIVDRMSVPLQINRLLGGGSRLDYLKTFLALRGVNFTLTETSSGLISKVYVLTVTDCPVFKAVQVAKVIRSMEAE